MMTYWTAWKRRVFSIALAAAMLLSLLPLSAFAASADVSVAWEPGAVAEDGTGTVELTAKLNEESGITSAVVYIQLTEAEKNALTTQDTELAPGVSLHEPGSALPQPPAGDESIEEPQIPTEPVEDPDIEGQDTPTETEDPDSEEPNTGDPNTPTEPEGPETPVVPGGETDSEPDSDTDDKPDGGISDEPGTGAGDDSSGQSTGEPGGDSTGGENIGESDKTGGQLAGETADPTPETSTKPSEETAEVTDGEDAADQPGTETMEASLLLNDAGTWTLCVELIQERLRVTQELAFALGGDNPEKIDVTPNDIRVDYTPAVDETGAPLNIDIDTAPLSLKTEGPTGVLVEENAIDAETDTLTLAENAETLADFAFTFALQYPADGQGPYGFTLTLPDGVSLPETTEQTVEIVLDEDCAGADAELTITAAEGQTLTFTLALDNGADDAGNAAAQVVDTIIETFSQPMGVTGRLCFTGSAFAVDYNTLFGAGSGGDRAITLAAGQDQTAGQDLTASVTLAPPDTEAAYTQGELTSRAQTVNWYDNNSADRPDLYPTISYIITGTDGTTVESGTLNETTLKRLGFKGWPIETTTDGLAIVLPDTLLSAEKDAYGNPTATYNVDWTITPPELPGYILEVTEDGAWNYTRTQDFTFTLEMKRGAADALDKDEVMALLGQFVLTGQTNQTGTAPTVLPRTEFSALEDLTITSGGGDTYTVTIPGLPAYQTGSGYPLVYWVTEKGTGEGGEANDKITAGDLLDTAGEGLLPEDDDWFAVAYSNAGVDDAGGSTESAYSGGRLILTLTGETGYRATKVWLDDGTTERPTAEFVLWRYVADTGYDRASQVRESDVGLIGSDFVSAFDNEFGTDPDTNDPDTFTIEFKNDGEPLVLPKYNQDGSRYIYAAREYLGDDGTGHYEQVFGMVDEATDTVTETELPEGADSDNGSRKAGDTFVYNGGVLSNRLTEDTTVRVTKRWDAAAYQADFADVSVTFTLQQRVKSDASDDGSGETDTSATETEWTDTMKDGEPVTLTLEDFSAEQMSDSGSVTVPAYDGEGRLLEYRWVETTVTKGTETAEPVEHDGSVTFTLNQQPDEGGDPQQVTYRSTAETVDNSTTVTNRVEDDVDFALKKVWKERGEEGELVDCAAPKADITLNIYQTLSGTEFDFTEPFVQVFVPKDGTDPYLVDESGEQIDSAADGVTISTDAAAFNEANSLKETDWAAIVENLPKYDKGGHLYHYLVLEDSSFDKTGYVPTFENAYYSGTGDYSSVVINAPGEGDRIMVQKNWIDDGDELHREPVTLQAYYEKDGVPTEIGGPITVTDEDGTWVEFITLEVPDDVTLEQVYLVETQVGNHSVKHGAVENSIPSLSDWEAGSYTGSGDGGESHIFEVTTDNHRYQVTYDAVFPGDNDAPNSFPNGVEAMYTVTNRRLGNVDVTVSKNWVSGDAGTSGNEGVNALLDALKSIQEKNPGTQLALAFQLKFAEGDPGWDITNSGSEDTVRVGGDDSERVQIKDREGKNTTSVQLILSPGTEESYVRKDGPFCFWGLPKYDSTGAVVSYRVDEVWVMRDSDSGSWTVLDSGLDDARIKNLVGLDTLRSLWAEYTPAYTQTYSAYQDDETGPSLDLDTQKIAYRNVRGQKTDVTWYKEWRDVFADENGNRPDIYLDIYCVVHDAEGNEKIQLVRENYRWQIDGGGESETNSLLASVPATAVTLAAADAARSADGASVPMVLETTETSDPQNEVWSVTIKDVPKYDDNGFEIRYFAVERTEVRVSAYDYQAVKYAYVEGGTGAATADSAIIGDRDGEDRTDNFDAYTLDLDDGNWSDKPDNIGPFNNTEEPGMTYPRYALLAGGTFINTLDNSYSATGVKLWEGLPTGYLDDDPDLPTVVFELYQFTSEPTVGQMAACASDQAVATLTIGPDDWQHLAKSGNSYSFRIDYLGDNTVGENGQCEPPDVSLLETLEQLIFGRKAGDPLPLYNSKDGSRYYYRAREIVHFGESAEGGAPEAGQTAGETEQVYDIPQDMPANFTFKNTYHPELGALKAKKLLSLPADTSEDNGGFPTVTFQLSRTYTLSDGNTSKAETVSSVGGSSISGKLTWSSADVQKAFEEAKEKNSDAAGPVLLEHTFVVEGLPIYAPNGSKYVYTLTETGSLGGYLTYATAGDVVLQDGKDPKEAFTDANGDPQDGTVKEVTDLEPQPVDVEEGQTVTAGQITADNAQATFYNERKNTQEQVTLTGTKVWNDFGNAMGTRPQLPEGGESVTVTATADDPLQLVVTRQSAGGSTSDSLVLGVDYTITYAKVGENNWTFTIQGTDDSGELEKFATDATPWKYTVKETLTNGKLTNTEYMPTNTTGQWTEASAGNADADGNVAVGSVTNSIYTQVSFQKNWVDESGQPVDDTYIKDSVTVTFQLQVQETDGTWTDADKYFSAHVQNAASAIANAFNVTGTGWTKDEGFTATKTDTLSGAAWSGTFTNLPKFIKNVSDTTPLTYRVVEASVEYLGDTQTMGEPDGNGVCKVSDTGLVSGAQFTPSGNVTTNTLSAISVTVEKEWEDNDNRYDTRPNASPSATVTWESWFVLQRTIGGPSAADAQWENVEVVKLYGGDLDGTPAGGSRWSAAFTGLPTLDFDSGKTYTYRVRELKPKLDGGYNLSGTDSILENLVGPGGIYYESGNDDSFDYTADYSTGDGIVTENGGTVTVTNSLLMRPSDGAISVRKVWYDENGHQTPPAGSSVTVELQQRIGAGDWSVYRTVTLDGAPWTYTWEKLPVQQSGQSVSYRVVEQSHEPEDYIHISTTPDYENASYTITNVAPTDFTVTKNWNDNDNTASRPASVTVALYRTTDQDQIGTAAGEPVPVDEIDDAAQRTAVLSAGNDWKSTFEDLPKYDANGALYHYYALELNGNTAVADQGYVTYGGQQYHVSYSPDGATVTNTPSAALTGAKIWRDSGDAYATRPGTDAFRLTLWRKTDTSDWSAVDLAAEGITFRWTVNGDSRWQYAFDNLPQYDPNGGAYTYKVTEPGLTGYQETSNPSDGTAANGTGPTFTNTLTGTVTITGTKSWQGAVGEEPQLTLSRSTDGTNWTEVPGAVPVWTGTDGTQWTYTYSGLPKYDGSGVRYTYRVTEASQDGYDVYYSDGIAANGSAAGLPTPVVDLYIRNVERGSLTVTKQVTGNRASSGQEFDFTVTFSLPAGFLTANDPPRISWLKSDGTTGHVTFGDDGAASVTFRLRHGQTVTFTDLPGGTAYTVTETDDHGYVLQSWEGSTGLIPAGGTAEAVFVNYRGGSDRPHDPPEDPDDPPEDPDDPPKDPDDPPEDPDTDIPDDPTPGGDVPPDDPDTDIPDDPTPGGDVPPDDPDTEIPDEPTPGSNVPKLPQTGQL